MTLDRRELAVKVRREVLLDTWQMAGQESGSKLDGTGEVETG